MSTKITIKSFECGAECSHLYKDCCEHDRVYLQVGGGDVEVTAGPKGAWVTLSLSVEHATKLGLLNLEAAFEPATAPTVAPREGWWGVTRSGYIHGPARWATDRANYPWSIGTNFFMIDGRWFAREVAHESDIVLILPPIGVDIQFDAKLLPRGTTYSEPGPGRVLLFDGYPERAW